MLSASFNPLLQLRQQLALLRIASFDPSASRSEQHQHSLSAEVRTNHGTNLRPLWLEFLFISANVRVTIDATELPATDLTLQYVAVGRGTQNYTCATSNSHPVQLGAVATLFDATLLAYEDESALNSIPSIAVYIPLLSSNLVLPPPFNDLIVLGHHFFDDAGTPTFNLSSVDKILYGMKTADIKAPATANKGPAGTGAVDWLQLTSKPGYVSVGLSLVYRVVTAGGAAPINCTTEGVLTVQYAAEYWFYN